MEFVTTRVTNPSEPRKAKMAKKTAKKWTPARKAAFSKQMAAGKAAAKAAKAQGKAARKNPRKSLSRAPSELARLNPSRKRSYRRRSNPSINWMGLAKNTGAVAVGSYAGWALTSLIADLVMQYLPAGPLQGLGFVACGAGELLGGAYLQDMAKGWPVNEAVIAASVPMFLRALSAVGLVPSGAPTGAPETEAGTGDTAQGILSTIRRGLRSLVPGRVRRYPQLPATARGSLEVGGEPSSDYMRGTIQAGAQPGGPGGYRPVL